MRVLLVEDDESLGAGIRDALGRSRYLVEWVRDGALAIEALRSGGFDLVVLDLGLPRVDGMEVLRQARESGVRTPVLVLSARDTTSHRIGGLDAGADDYMVKPFDVDELLARLRVLERRQRGATDNRVEHGELEIDTGAMAVRLRGKPVPLQRREFLLLRKLLDNTGQVLSRQQLEESIYGWEGDVESNALEVHVHNLRRKLYPGLIRTVRGVGYVIDPSEAGG
jgi:two-component system response regulator QseB